MKSLRASSTSVLTFQQVQRLIGVMNEPFEVHGCGNFPTLHIRLQDLIREVTKRINASASTPVPLPTHKGRKGKNKGATTPQEYQQLAVENVKINGGLASHILASKHLPFNDIDLIFGVQLGLTCENFEIVKRAVLESLLEFLPPGVQRTRLSHSALKDAYVRKMVKVTTETDIWSLISLNNEYGRFIELKFVDKMRRQFEFSVDSFQIQLDSLMTFFENIPIGTALDDTPVENNKQIENSEKNKNKNNNSNSNYKNNNTETLGVSPSIITTGPGFTVDISASPSSISSSSGCSSLGTANTTPSRAAKCGDGGPSPKPEPLNDEATISAIFREATTFGKVLDGGGVETGKAGNAEGKGRPRAKSESGSSSLREIKAISKSLICLGVSGPENSHRGGGIPVGFCGETDLPLYDREITGDDDDKSLLMASRFDPDDIIDFSTGQSRIRSRNVLPGTDVSAAKKLFSTVAKEGLGSSVRLGSGCGRRGVLEGQQQQQQQHQQCWKDKVRSTGLKLQVGPKDLPGISAWTRGTIGASEIRNWGKQAKSVGDLRVSEAQRGPLSRQRATSYSEELIRVMMLDDDKSMMDGKLCERSESGVGRSESPSLGYSRSSSTSNANFCLSNNSFSSSTNFESFLSGGDRSSITNTTTTTTSSGVECDYEDSSQFAASSCCNTSNMSTGATTTPSCVTPEPLEEHLKRDGTPVDEDFLGRFGPKEDAPARIRRVPLKGPAPLPLVSLLLNEGRSADIMADDGIFGAKRASYLSRGPRIRISQSFYPTVTTVSLYGDFAQALYHLDERLIDTKRPEEIRGGGLFKYCNLIVKGYRPVNGKQMRHLERYMCSRFFIDFPEVTVQHMKLFGYLDNHFHGDPALKYDYLVNLYRIIAQSTVCLMSHERQTTLEMIENVSYQISMEMSSVANTLGAAAAASLQYTPPIATPPTDLLHLHNNQQHHLFHKPPPFPPQQQQQGCYQQAAPCCHHGYPATTPDDPNFNLCCYYQHHPPGNNPTGVPSLLQTPVSPPDGFPSFIGEGGKGEATPSNDITSAPEDTSHEVSPEPAQAGPYGSHNNSEGSQDQPNQQQPPQQQQQLQKQQQHEQQQQPRSIMCFPAPGSVIRPSPPPNCCFPTYQPQQQQQQPQPQQQQQQHQPYMMVPFPVGIDLEQYGGYASNDYNNSRNTAHCNSGNSISFYDNNIQSASPRADISVTSPAPPIRSPRKFTFNTNPNTNRNKLDNSSSSSSSNYQMLKRSNSSTSSNKYMHHSTKYRGQGSVARPSGDTYSAGKLSRFSSGNYGVYNTSYNVGSRRASTSSNAPSYTTGASTTAGRKDFGPYYTPTNRSGYSRLRPPLLTSNNTKFSAANNTNNNNNMTGNTNNNNNSNSNNNISPLISGLYGNGRYSSGGNTARHTTTGSTQIQDNLCNVMPRRQTVLYLSNSGSYWFPVYSAY